MSKQIFLVYSCNEWKQNPMPLLMATTSARKMKMFVSDMIEKEDAIYGYEGPDYNPKKRAAEFRRDFGKLTRNELNSSLTFAQLDYTYDGEEI